jgi:hypothetical protein
MHGSTATRVPTACRHSGPASITRPEISWPSTKGNEPPIPIRVGDGPVLWAKRWGSLPQIPPTVTAMRAHAAPRSWGSGIRRARPGIRDRPCRTARRARRQRTRARGGGSRQGGAVERCRA